MKLTEIDLETIDALAEIVVEHGLEQLTVGNITITKKMHLVPDVKTEVIGAAVESDDELLFASAQG